MGKIYHYTTIETLALILKHKTIRFNRLDQMDDLCERNYFGAGINWSPYTYVSCWTENSEDNLLLWHMYAKGGTGIRITLDKDFIDWNNVSQNIIASFQSQQPPKSNKVLACGSITMNKVCILGPLNSSACYHTINYEHNDNVRIGSDHTNLLSISENNFKEYIGIHKMKEWESQKESRFIIYAVPFNSPDGEIRITNKDFIDAIGYNPRNDLLCFDLPIKIDALNDIEIKLGPNVNDAQAIIVHTLLRELLSKKNTDSIVSTSKFNTQTWRDCYFDMI